MDNKKIIASIKKLAKDECANYNHGFCLLTDKRCHIINPNYESIHDGAIDCDYFLENVLPADWELRDLVAYALWYDEADDEAKDARQCKKCGKVFLPGSTHSRQWYCSACANEKKKQNGRNRIRKYRSQKQ